MLSDLRESGSIEQDADIILFLYRDAYYETTAENKSIADCIIAKNRHGQTDTVRLGWRGEYTLFTNLDNIRQEH
jgi:replicative DNA helicase